MKERAKNRVKNDFTRWVEFYSNNKIQSKDSVKSFEARNYLLWILKTHFVNIFTII
jgi:hypothetical protein